MILVYFIAGVVVGSLLLAVVCGSRTNYDKGYEHGFNDCNYLWEHGKPFITDENEII